MQSGTACVIYLCFQNMCSACLAACLNPLESRDRRGRTQNEGMCDKTKEIKQTGHPEHGIQSKPRETDGGQSITNVHSFNLILLFQPPLLVIMP